MELLAEHRWGDLAVFLHDDGFTVFYHSGAEFTEYAALAQVVVCAAVLLLIWTCVRPATPRAHVLRGSLVLGAGAMLFGVSTASLLSVVALILVAMGLGLGLAAFGLWAAAWGPARALFPSRLAPRPARATEAVEQAVLPAPPDSSKDP